MRENIQHLPFQLGISSFNMKFSSSIHVSTRLMLSFFFTAEQFSLLYMYYIFIIPQLVERHLSRFHFPPIVNGDAMNMCEQAHVESGILSFRYMLQSCVSGSYDRFLFSFWRILYTDFHTCCKIQFLSIEYEDDTIKTLLFHMKCTIYSL